MPEPGSRIQVIAVVRDPASGISRCTAGIPRVRLGRGLAGDYLIGPPEVDAGWRSRAWLHGITLAKVCHLAEQMLQKSRDGPRS